jgi:hypothetical protein
MLLLQTSWWHILVALGADASQVGRDSMLSWWNAWRARWLGDKRKGADSLFVLVAWELWKERNGMLSPSLVHGNADPHAHRRPMDRRRRGEVTLSFARVISLYLSLLGGEKLLV